MKKLSLLGLLGVVYVALTMMSCTGKQPEQQPTGKDSLAVDSSSVAEDTVAVEPQTAKAADKLFADFFFDFISKKKVQMNRILFPLPVTENGKTKTVERRAWRMEHFYQNQEYYTQIFDNDKQRDDVRKRDVDTVVVEKIHLKKGIAEQYVFCHPQGFWVLASINKVGLSQSNNASFLTFLQKFFADKKFQLSHVANPLSYEGPDPDGDDETTVVKRKIPAHTWSDYLPEIPRDQIYNIVYGQTYAEGKEKIFLFKGISNGLETELKFRKTGSDWKLTKINL